MFLFLTLNKQIILSEFLKSRVKNFFFSYIYKYLQRFRYCGSHVYRWLFCTNKNINTPFFETLESSLFLLHKNVFIQWKNLRRGFTTLFMSNFKVSKSHSKICLSTTNIGCYGAFLRELMNIHAMFSVYF